MALRQPIPSHWNSGHESVSESNEHMDMARSSWIRSVILLWLIGLVVLLPLDMFRLPLNVTLVDIWIALALPFAWLFIPRKFQFISMTYAVAIWFILAASFISAFAAPSARNALVVILKEVFIFVWLMTVAWAFAGLSDKDRRRVLFVWTGMVFLHGAILIGQFLSPPFWHFIINLAGEPRDYEFYRPSGLFMNANSAGFFQLLGFVPLLLLKFSRTVGIVLGFLLLSTMLVTGSMGATLAFLAGSTAAVIMILLRGHLMLIFKSFVQMTILLSVVGGLLFLVVSQNERYQEHISRILLGRAERSSEGRFDLWQRGIDTFLEGDVYLWGIGPENFRVVDRQGKQLHNDILAFTVERGLIGTLGLAMFALAAAGRAVYIVLLSSRGNSDQSRLVVVVFLGAVVAAVIESLTHQTFHFRELWLILALQEGMVFKMTRSRQAIETAHKTGQSQ